VTIIKFLLPTFKKVKDNSAFLFFGPSSKKSSLLSSSSSSSLSS
jgi:hypothetical protein